MEYKVLLSEDSLAYHEVKLNVSLARGGGPPNLVVNDTAKKVQYTIDAEDLYVALVGDRNSVEIPVVREACQRQRLGDRSGKDVTAGDGNFFDSHEESDVTIKVDGHALRSLRDRVLKHLPRPTSVCSKEIAPSHFYGEQELPKAKKLKYFHRQDDAFLYFDTLKTKDRSNLKIYSFEKHTSGQRAFIVAQNDVFLKEYTISDSCNRHVYESIRDGFPCRLYFDLEYAKVTNRNTDGDVLTEEWIKLVAWKVHQLWGFALEAQNFVVFDSSTLDKFSKHVIVVIPHDSATSHGLHLSGELKECLFLDNEQVKLFVDTIVKDITYEGEEDVCSAQADGRIDPEESKEGCRSSQNVDKWLRTPARRNVIRPRTEYKQFWVNKKEGSGQSFFVDTGVYSRNRVFRLYGSCKRSDNPRRIKPTLRLSRADSEKYGPFLSPPDATSSTKVKHASDFNIFGSSTMSSIRHLSNDSTSSKHGIARLVFTDSKLEREHLYARNLSLGAVVPEDLFVSAPQPPFAVHLQGRSNNKQSTIGTANTRAMPTSNNSPVAAKRPCSDDYPIQVSSPQQCSAYIGSSPSNFNSAESARTISHSSVDETFSGDLKMTTACDPLSFNPKYSCLLLPRGPHGGTPLVGEFPQNWICHQHQQHTCNLQSATTCTSPIPLILSSASCHQSVRGEDGYGVVVEPTMQKSDDHTLEQPFYNLNCPGRSLLREVCLGSGGVTRTFEDSTVYNHLLKQGPWKSNTGLSTLHLERSLIGSNENYKRFQQDSELCSGEYGIPSPFPKVDTFVSTYIRSTMRGGDVVEPPGYISKWIMSGQMGHGDTFRQIYIKIRYHIGGGYRFCANVRRHHKSNGIMIDVLLNEHLAARALTQVCWDPECRGFKSEAEPVPYTVLPQAYELDRYKEEIYDRHVLKLFKERPGALEANVSGVNK